MSATPPSTSLTPATKSLKTPKAAAKAAKVPTAAGTTAAATAVKAASAAVKTTKVAGKGFSHESSSSESREWYAPPSLYDMILEAGKLVGMDGFELDPCSPGKDIVHWSPAKYHLTIKEDGLKTPWIGSGTPIGRSYGRVWLNCPYSAATNGLWLQKLIEHGAGIAILFARTDAHWFHDWALKCDGLFFLKGRVKFITPAEAPFIPRRGPDGKLDSAGVKILDALAGKEAPPPSGGPGAGSMLLACGPICCQTLQKLDEMGRGVYMSL